MINDINLLMGSSFWMEPYKYEEDKKYYGPYIYKDKGELVTTWDYSNSDYDYFTYEWYKNGFKGEGSIWTDSYYDEVNVTGISDVPVLFFRLAHLLLFIIFFSSAVAKEV